MSCSGQQALMMIVLMQRPPAQAQAMPSDGLGTPDGTELSIRGNTGHEPVAQLALRLTGE